MLAERMTTCGKRCLAATGWLLIGVALVALAASLVRFGVVRTWLDSYAGDGSADPYTPELHARLQCVAMACGSILLACGGAVWLARRRYSAACGRMLATFWLDLRGLMRWLAALSRPLRWSLAAITLLAAAVRFPYLDQAMRFDEAYTWNAYASQPWFVTISAYDAPNNHVLHSLLVHVVTAVAGDAPWSVRLPAFAAGILVVPATMLLAAALGGGNAARLAGLLAAVSSPLVEYSTNARGYTMLCLLTVLGWLLARRLACGRNSAAWIAWGACAALGCLTIPVMLYPLSMQVAWMVWLSCTGMSPRADASRFRLELAGALGAAAMVTLIGYAPVMLVSGPRALFGNTYIQPLHFIAVVKQVPAWIEAVDALLLRDVPWSAAILLLMGICVALWNDRRWVRRSRVAALGSLVSCLILILAQRVLPFPRVWLFLIPLGATLASIGLVRVLRNVRWSGLRTVAGMALVVVIAGWPLWNLVRHDSVRRSLETGTLPDAEAIIRDLAGTLRPGEPIVTVSPSSAELVYYAHRIGLDPHHFDWPATAHTRDDCAVVVVNRQHPEQLGDVLRALGLQETLGQHEFRLHAEYPSAWVYRWLKD